MGIILYEFLVGCVPFFGDTPEELFGQVITGKKRKTRNGPTHHKTFWACFHASPRHFPGISGFMLSLLLIAHCRKRALNV